MSRRRFVAVVGAIVATAAAVAALVVWSMNGGGPDVRELLSEGDYYRSLEGAQNIRMALERYREAVRIDSSSAPSLAKLAQAYVLLDEGESEHLARRLLDRAASIDSTAPEVQVARGLTFELYDRDWQRAEESFRQAVSTDPAFSVGWYELGWLLIRAGKVAEGVESMQRARALDSGSPLTLYGVGVADYYSGRYENAARTFWDLFRSEPGHLYAWGQMLRAYLHGGLTVEAAEAVNRIPDPGPFYRSPLGAYYLAVTGAERSAREVMSDLGDQSSEWDRAMVFVALDEPDRALDALEAALQDPPRAMLELAIEPAFEPLRGDPRFLEMLEGLGLEPAGD